jgi:MFS family permease
MYDERLVRHTDDASPRRGRVKFRSVLAFENFVLLMAVVFGLQLVDRSFSPVLPLYLSQLGTPFDRVPLVAGLLLSIAAATGAVGNHLSARLLDRVSARAVIAASAGVGGVGALVYALAPHSSWLFAAAPILGLAMGCATTSTYTAASGVIPPTARGAGFGMLATASLTALALSPILAGILGATSIRAVFVLDVAALAVIAAVVSRVMAVAPREKTTTPAPEEL